MIQSSDPEAGQAYTRASVEAYLRAAAEERARIEAAIAAARSRTVWALRQEEHLGSLAPGSGTVPGGERSGGTSALLDTPPDGTLVDGDPDAGAAVPGRSESLIGRLPFPGEHDGHAWREPGLPTAVARD